jgi:hypothetical protein
MNRAFSPPPSPNGQPNNREPVAAYLDELHSQWKRAEEELAAIHVQVPVEVEVKTDYGGVADAGSGPEPSYQDTVYLGWRKHMNKWRLCVGVLRDYLNGEQSEPRWTPIAESSKDMRIEFAAHVLKLEAKMRETQRNLIPQIAAAIASLKQALGG